jgi:DNA-binding transcriptional LysR family regulator
MDLRHLNYFLVLAEELHFGRAAERLNMSQPPLSRMIQQIENDAKQMVLQMQTVKKRLSIFGKGETGTIKIGYVGAVMHTELPNFLAAFSAKYPDINLQFEEQPNNSLLYGLNNGTLDIAFVRTWLHSENLDEKVIFNEPFVAVLPLKHPLAKKQKLAIKDLKDENFITFTRECSPTIFDNFLALCSNAGFTPHISHNASQLNSVLRLVESGFGVSMLPKSTEAGFKLKLKFLPLINSKETVPLIMLTRKENLSPALSHLKTHLLKTS